MGYNTTTPPGRFVWQVDESSVAELKAWFDEHGDTKWAKFAEMVNVALQSKSVDVLRNFIPEGPVPVKSLADGLFSLVELVVVSYFHLSSDFGTETHFSKFLEINRMFTTLLFESSRRSIIS